ATSREAAAASGRAANTDLRMLVGYRTVCAVPHASKKVYRRARDSSICRYVRHRIDDTQRCSPSFCELRVLAREARSCGFRQPIRITEPAFQLFHRTAEN